MKKQVRFSIFFLFAVFLEVALLTFWRALGGMYVSGPLFFLVSLAVGVLFVFGLQKGYRIPITGEGELRWLGPGLYAGGVFLSAFVLQAVFARWPISAENISKSDVLPQMMYLVRRFLNGEMPYQMITDWAEHDLFPTYQPLQWMPYVLAEWGGFDYRWIGFGFLAIAGGLHQWVGWRKGLSWPALVLLAAFPFLLLLTFTQRDEANIGLTAELLNTAYYLLLGLALISNRWWWIALAMGLCLLGRYSLVLWVPLVLLLWWRFRDRVQAYKMGGIMVGMVLLFWLPFLSQDILAPIRGLEMHDRDALRERELKAFQEEGEIPFQLSRGLGWAIYSYEATFPNIKSGLRLNQRVHFTLCLLVIFFLGLWYFRVRQKPELHLFLLGGLKIYFAFFYHFIHIPYPYLFLVPVMLDASLLLALLGQIDDRSRQSTPEAQKTASSF